MTPPRNYFFGHTEVRPAERTVLVDGKVIAIGARAFDILLVLIEHRERLVTKVELLDLVWPNLVVEESNLPTQVSALRKALGSTVIATIPGRGYRFAATLDTGGEAHVAAPAQAAPPTTTTRPRATSARTGMGLLGRDDDLDTLRQLVRTESLVTVVGPSGIGKTRLVQALGESVAGDHAAGVRIVELAPIADPALIPAAVAQAAGVPLSGRLDARTEVIDALRGRQLLLILDNCEHLVQEAADFVRALLERAPRLKVLATSQEVLKVPGERVYRLGALAVPAMPEVASAHKFGAIRLFVERVEAQRPDFVLGPDNVAHVVAICTELDGLPLAIELAAARVPLLGVAGVRERLGERFRLLTGGSRTAPRRHQALREAIDWSHALLSDTEKAVFRRTGVFAGGFYTAAAEHILADAEIDAWGVLDTLGALVDKSLVVVDGSDPPRYHLLESSREYALEQLRASAEEATTRARHAAYYLAEAEAAEPRVTSASRRAPLARLRIELNNFRNAMAWLLRQRDDAGPALRLAAALAWLAYFEGIFAEARAWMAEAMAMPDAGTPAHLRDRAAVLSGAARLAAYAGDSAQAMDMARESVALWRRAGEARGLAYALFHLGIASIVGGQSERARAPLAEALASFRQLADPWGVALGASYLGTSYAIIPGTEAEARELLLDGRARFRALGDEWGASVSSHYLGSIALRTGDLAMASQLTEEMLANARELGDKYRIARNLHQLGEILIAGRQLTDAARHVCESLGLNVQQGRLGDAAQQLRLLAWLASELGANSIAIRLAAIAARHVHVEPTMPRDDPARHVALLEALRTSVGPDEFRDEFARGEAMSLDDAIALVQNVIEGSQLATRIGARG